MKTFVKILIGILVILGIAAGVAFSAYHFYLQPPAPTPGEKEEDTLDGNRKYNILCCGVDESRENADTIILATFDPETQDLKLLSLPRDTMSNVERTIKKLNASYSDDHPGDIEQTMKEVKMLTGLKVDRYVVTTFDGFKKAIDALGGVRMDVPEDLYYIDPYQDLEININAGEQILDGSKALQFVRYRSGYSEGDLGRIKAQQLFFEALGHTLLNPANVTKIPALAEVVRDEMDTDMSMSEMLWFAKQMKGMDLKKNVSMYMLPGYPDYVDELSYFIPDEAGIVNMLNKEYAKKEPWVAEDLDLVPLAKEVHATFGYGSGDAANPPTVIESEEPLTGEEVPVPSPQPDYGYGGAYTPPGETNTNQPARGYTTVGPQPAPQQPQYVPQQPIEQQQPTEQQPVEQQPQQPAQTQPEAPAPEQGY